MTEPDEALLYARERAKRRFSVLSTAGRNICAQIDAGKRDGKLEVADASAYRAGQAASAERIKALEGDLMWTDQAWEAAQEAVVYGYTLMDKQDERIKALEGEVMIHETLEREAQNRATGFDIEVQKAAVKERWLNQRIKALVEALKDSVTAMQLTLDAVERHNTESTTFLSGFPLHVMSRRIADARALLKETDQ